MEKKLSAARDNMAAAEKDCERKWRRRMPEALCLIRKWRMPGFKNFRLLWHM